MRFLPHTAEEIRTMLERIGVRRVEDLFADIPDEIRFRGALDLPSAMSEPEVVAHLARLGARNGGLCPATRFLGAGAYQHHLPAAVGELALRSEFVTAYTPYQPELSQGTLQAIFEFQTLICLLTGMEVANASMYDGASALAEAVLMAGRLTRKREVLLSAGVHPLYRRVVTTYAQHLGYDLRTVPLTGAGVTDTGAVEELLGGATAAVVVQSPNFYGMIEPVASLSSLTAGRKTMLIDVVADLSSLGVLAAPGDQGADLVVGEAQTFGNALSFGGPFVGFMAARQELVRNLPGRLAGMTRDLAGRRGFVLTLSTREQHIRRERATSNICTNQNLCALMATIHMAMLGRRGVRELAVQSAQKAHYLQERLSALPGCRSVFGGRFYHEFLVELDRPVEPVLRELAAQGIQGGLALSRVGGDERRLLVCATEVNTRSAMDDYVSALGRILQGEAS
jgi:glycine dehydrogenase subunit 1